MKVSINNDSYDIKVASISTLLDIVSQIETRVPKGYVITEIALNDKVLESNWYYNAKKIYLLDEDRLSVRAEDPSQFSLEILKNSKAQYLMILEDFERIAESFRMEEEKKANHSFIQGIENLQWYFKILEDATQLLGKPLNTLMDNNTSFKQYVGELEVKLEEIIQLQTKQDWVMLADVIEYELVPELRKIFRIYDILDI